MGGDYCGTHPVRQRKTLRGAGAVAKSAPSSESRALRELPPQFGQAARTLARVQRVVRAGDAFGRALVDALQDGGDPKQVVGHEKVPVFDRAASGALAVARDVLRLGRDAERSVIEIRDAAKGPRRNVPAHAVITEVGQRMAKRR